MLSVNALVPVVLKDAGFTPPDVATFFVVARNGIFLERRSAIYSASVPADRTLALLPHDARLDLRLPRLPKRMVAQVMGFFREVWRRYEGEAMVVFFYDPATRRYLVEAPQQVLPGRLEGHRFRATLRLVYGECPRPDGSWIRIGTMHSHGACAPTHSGIDEGDEANEPGLSITAGYVDTDRPEFEATFVVGEQRFPVAIPAILPPYSGVRPAPDAWFQRIALAHVRPIWAGPHSEASDDPA